MLNTISWIYYHIQGRHLEHLLDASEGRNSETTPQKAYVCKTFVLLLCAFIRLLQAWLCFLAHPG
jgi:hypothetical protein